MAEIRFGPAGVPIRFGSVKMDEAVRRTAEELGLGAFEMEFVYGARSKKELMESVRKEAESKDVVISSHAPYYVNLCNKEKMASNIRHLVSSALLTQHAGGWITVFHPGFYQKKSPEEAYKEAKRQIMEVINEYKARGGKGVLFGAETVGKKSQFGGLQEVVRLAQEVEGVIPVIDFAHLVARGDWRLKTKDDYRKLFDYLEKELGREYVENIHAHFSEIEYSEKGEKRHLPLGTKYEPDYRQLIEVMVEHGYGGTIISETPALEEDALKMKLYYEKVRS